MTAITYPFAETKLPRPNDALWFTTFLAVALFLVAALIEGCGASAATRSAYALEQARCIANEREIVDRPGTTAEQDTDDMELERARCDHALRTIEESE